MKTKCELFNHKRHPVYDCSSQLGVQIAQCECQIIHFKMCQSFGSTCIQWFNWEIEIVCCVPNERILKIHTVTLFHPVYACMFSFSFRFIIVWVQEITSYEHDLDLHWPCYTFLNYITTSIINLSSYTILIRTHRHAHIKLSSFSM